MLFGGTEIAGDAITNLVMCSIGLSGLVGLVGMAEVLASSNAFAQISKDLNANFKYELKLSADINQRAACDKKFVPPV